MLRFHSFLLALVVSVSILCFLFGFPTWSYWELSQQLQIRRRLSINAFSDPKTISSKNNQIDSLRFAAFGTSRTWGTGLDDPASQTYIKLLSPNGINFGSRATGADYPSLCLNTILGDHKEFDVIVIEFSPTDFDDFERLVKRLRARFPSAIIIYLSMIMPLHDLHFRGKVVVDQLSELGIDYNKVPVVKVLQHMNAAEFSFPLKQLYEDSVAKCSKIVHNVGGHVLEFPVIDSHIKKFILDNAKYFGSAIRPLDFVHPSVAGHQEIAHLVRAMVTKILASQQGSVTTSVDGANLSNDACTTFYSGAPLSSQFHVIRNLQNLNLVSMAYTHNKWALEVERTGAELTIICGFPNCGIYLSYMAKGPHREYPRVHIQINDNQDPILVDPYLTNFHVRKTVFLGTVKESGDVTVLVTPLPGDMNSLMLFRIAGINTFQQT